MKTLLKNGPLHGKIVQTDRNQFGYGEVMTVSVAGGPETIKEDYKYWNTYERETHPEMKRGKIRVFEFGPDPETVRNRKYACNKTSI